jgi:hypothetical protein
LGSNIPLFVIRTPDFESAEGHVIFVQCRVYPAYFDPHVQCE